MLTRIVGIPFYMLACAALQNQLRSGGALLPCRGRRLAALHTVAACGCAGAGSSPTVAALCAAAGCGFVGGRLLASISKCGRRVPRLIPDSRVQTGFPPFTPPSSPGATQGQEQARARLLLRPRASNTNPYIRPAWCPVRRQHQPVHLVSLGLAGVQDGQH